MFIDERLGTLLQATSRSNVRSVDGQISFPRDIGNGRGALLASYLTDLMIIFVDFPHSLLRFIVKMGNAGNSETWQLFSCIEKLSINCFC